MTFIPSASTSTTTGYYWVSASTSTLDWLNFSGTSLLWMDVWDVQPHEKSIHGRLRGKLREPKKPCPKGFKHMTMQRYMYSGKRGQ